MLGRGDLLDDARFSSNEARVVNREEVDTMIARETVLWERDVLLRHFAKAGVPAGPINNLDEVFADPQIQARGMQVKLDGMPGVRSPFRFSDAELALDKPSPTLGEDS